MIQVTEGVEKKNEFILIYGTDGMGKSTFGSDAPKPIFIDFEKRSGHLKVSRVKPSTLEEAMEYMESLKKDDKYKSVVVDSVDWLEPLIIESVVRKAGKKNIKEVGAYGAGYDLVMEEWRKFVRLITELRETKHIILTGHSEVKTINDPTTTPYDRYQLKLYSKASAMLRECVDCLLFCNTETVATEKRGFSDNKRWVFTERRPSYDAKNSFGLPEKFELKEVGGFSYYLSLKGDGADPKALERQIIGMAKSLSKEDEEKVLALMKDADVAKLQSIKNKLEAFLS